MNNINVDFSEKYGTEYTSDLTIPNVEAGMDDLATFTCDVAIHDGNRGNMTVTGQSTGQLTVYSM